MEPAKGESSLSALRSLAWDLLRRAIRKGVLHAFAGSVLFLAAASLTIRIGLESPADGSLARTLGKTGIFALYLAAGVLAGSLHGAASAFLGRLDEVGKRTAAFLDAELVAKVSGERAADSAHALKLRLSRNLAEMPALGILRLFPFVGSLLRTLEAQGPPRGGATDIQAHLLDALVGSVTDDLRSQANRAKRFAAILAAGFFSVPVLLLLFGS